MGDFNILLLVTEKAHQKKPPNIKDLNKMIANLTKYREQSTTQPLENINSFQLHIEHL